jgi:hypothetical protein
MIKDAEAYRRQSDRDRWEALARMTPAESIAVGEALLTSEIMSRAVFPDDDQPRSLAIALGITSPAAPGPDEDAGDSEPVR